ncbi:fatty acid desaturase [Crocosphaera chwakensis]|uniref:Probable hydrocarbon oxygenase MocD n=1 Tax=Crocosphaera chwakensis CCY0110 TaxID=391612 RepID=A3IQE2_9CHRO|nr:fatty acid desaturase [Crocosphaera chwakensis]EAZ91217.1 probable hydrocarbon oxygenase MocD [Crocosphaera chwakensis CCY0110]
MSEQKSEEISVPSSFPIASNEIPLELHFERDLTQAKAYLSPQQVFSLEGLAQLNQLSNLKGCLQLLLHLSVIVVSGFLWLSLDNLIFKIPALIIYGFSIASMFAALHECVHYTAFANRRLNEIIGWIAGLFSFYNSTFYRSYHQWHHRYTRLQDQDPELTDLTPINLWQYLWIISGIPWWLGKFQTHFFCAIGLFHNFPYIRENARVKIQRSVQLQLLTYLVAIAVSFYYRQPWFVVGWLFPLAIGQPILRFILLAEHTDCTLDANPFANTRTTLTITPIRLLMWNMPFHAEHHFCPSIPFHALKKAHQSLLPHLKYAANGYIKFNLALIKNF